MRISDWSSDVCSYDLISANARKLQQLRFTLRKATTIFPRHHSGAGEQVARPRIIAKARPCGHQISLIGSSQGSRSEEHTSELQSLMRISYAVFCLKKKKNDNNYINNYRTEHELVHTQQP